MSIKVVYNDQHGGFSLSTEAVKLGRKISGDPQWANATLYGERYGDGSIAARFSSLDAIHISEGDLKRHDHVLVKVVEELGDKAGGSLASLCIHEVEGDRYIIRDYDGLEWVEEPKDIEWVIVEAGESRGEPPQPIE